MKKWIAFATLLACIGSAPLSARAAEDKMGGMNGKMSDKMGAGTHGKMGTKMSGHSMRRKRMMMARRHRMRMMARRKMHRGMMKNMHHGMMKGGSMMKKDGKM